MSSEHDMPSTPPLQNRAISIAEWRELAARDPERAARELARRLETTLSPAQRRACFASVGTPDELAAAFRESVDLRWREHGRDVSLAGVPYTLKDLYHVAGQEAVRAGSGFPAGVLPAHDGTCALPRALGDAGAVLAARTQLHEFAYGLTGENPHYGDCEHPRFPGRTSGGSSSGAAASVAAGIVPFAVGTDTGGSIRVPAAFCGLFGMRLTPGDAWISDAFPLAPAFDTAGWLTRTAEDMVAVNRCVFGEAERRRKEPRGCFVGLVALEAAGVAQARESREYARALQKAGEQFATEVDAAMREEIGQAFRGAAEAYAVLQSVQACEVHARWLDEYRACYGVDVWKRIDRGRRWAPGQIEAAHAKQRGLRRFWDSFFADFDFLAMPATPFVALTKAECTQENRERMLALTVPASLGGLPVLTVPVGLASGLSGGVQIIVSDARSAVIEWVLGRGGVGGRD